MELLQYKYKDAYTFQVSSTDIETSWRKFKVRARQLPPEHYCSYDMHEEGVLKVWNADTHRLEEVDKSEWASARPVFFEDHKYTLSLTFFDAQEEPRIIHPNKEVEQMFNCVHLASGEYLINSNIDFLNQPGHFALEFAYKNVEGKHICHGLFGVTAPYYLTIYSEKRDRSEMNAGYLAEHLCLYMLTLGLGSCFLGSVTLRGIPKVRMEPNVPSARRESSALYETAPASAAEGSQMPSGSRTTRESARRSPSRKELVIVIAFGIPAGRLTRRPEHAKRLPVRELCVYKDQPSRWMTQVIEAARLAPSAMNRQPWRFVVVNTRIHIFSKKDGMDKPRRWDEFSFGVMFAHIAIASEELWLDVDLIRLENISQKNFKSNQYVLSAIVRVPE